MQDASHRISFAGLGTPGSLKAAVLLVPNRMRMEREWGGLVVCTRIPTSSGSYLETDHVDAAGPNPTCWKEKKRAPGVRGPLERSVLHRIMAHCADLWNSAYLLTWTRLKDSR